MTNAPAIDISIVVPFHDAARTLGRCLESLLEQEGSVEVIAVDDGSSDDSAGIAADVAARHPRGSRLRILRRADRGGAQRARMDGVAASRGEIVALTDADCVAPPDFTQRIRAALTPELVAVGGQYRVPEGLPIVARFETRSLLDYWYRHMPEATDHVATGCCAVWRRHLVPEVMAAGLGFADLTSGDDTAMSLELARRGPLRYDPELHVLHHTRTTLRGYLSQQLRRGQSRSRISMSHFDAKVRGARDTRMGLVLAQIASAWAPLAAAPVLAALGHVAAAAATVVPFVLLQAPLLRSSIQARESGAFLALVLPLAYLRNLAWGLGGVLGVVRGQGVRQVQLA